MGADSVGHDARMHTTQRPVEYRPAVGTAALTGTTGGMPTLRLILRTGCGDGRGGWGRMCERTVNFSEDFPLERETKKILKAFIM